MTNNEIKKDLNTNGTTCANCDNIANDGVMIDGVYYCKHCFEEMKQDGSIYFCEGCQEWHEGEAYWTCDGDEYCEAAFDDLVSVGDVYWCNACEDWHLEADEPSTIVYTNYHNSEVWCQYYVDRNAFFCEDCGYYYSNDYYGGRVRGVGCVCEHCISNYYYCEDCDGYYTEDDFNFYADRCNECGGGRYIHNYGYKPTPIFYGKGTRFYGVELEVDDGRNKYEAAAAVDDLLGEDRAYCKTDGSLTEAGFEIVTHPHTEEELFKLDWRALFDKLKSYGYKSHDTNTCGLHLHISRTGLGSTRYKQDLAIAKIIAFFDIYYNEVLKISRRDRERAERWASMHYIGSEDIKNTIKNASDIAKNGSSTRYRCVNINNAKTLEIRIMRGTLNHTTFKTCIKFIMRVCQNAKRIKWDNLYNYEEWLKGIDEETLTYIRSKGAFIDFTRGAK